MSYYEAGTAADVNDMLGKLRTALAANGYTLVTNDKAGSSGGQFAQLSKNGLVVNLRTGFDNEIPVALEAERSTRWGSWNWSYYWQTYVNSQYVYNYWRPSWIAMNLSTGVDGGKSWHNQPGAPGSTEGKGIAVMALAYSGAISRYWIFIEEDPDTVVLVMEVYPNKFERLCFGRLILNQDIQAGGEWFEGSRPIFRHWNGLPPAFHSSLDSSTTWDNDGHVFCRLKDTRWTISDQLDGWHHSVFTSCCANSYGPGNYWANLGLPQPDDNTSNPETAGFRNAINQSYLRDEGRSILHPIAAWKQMEGGGYTLLGHVGHIALCSMESVLAGEALAGVGETYLAFPGHQRISPWTVTKYSSTDGTPAGETYNFYGMGFAVRKP